MTDGSFSDETRQAILAARGGRCAGCGRIATETHHRRPRMMGGTSRPGIGEAGNGVPLCAAHHAAAESEREAARVVGWLVPPAAADATVELGRPWWTVDGWRRWVLEEDQTLLGTVRTWLVAYVDPLDLPDSVARRAPAALAALGITPA